MPEVCILQRLFTMGSGGVIGGDSVGAPSLRPMWLLLVRQKQMFHAHMRPNEWGRARECTYVAVAASGDLGDLHLEDDLDVVDNAAGPGQVLPKVHQADLDRVCTGNGSGGRAYVRCAAPV